MMVRVTTAADYLSCQGEAQASLVCANHDTNRSVWWSGEKDASRTDTKRTAEVQHASCYNVPGSNERAALVCCS